jgi:hypothetical protein
MEAYLARLSLVLAMVHASQARSSSTGVSGEVMNSDPIVGQRSVEASVALIEYFKAHARRVYAKLGDSRKQHSKTGKNLLPTVIWFLKAEGGHWEGMTHELFNIFKENSVSDLPGGVGPFGKVLRKIAHDPDNDLVLKEVWRRGNQPIIKLSLSTLGTLGDARLADAETTEGTESRNEGGKVTANHPDPVIHEEDQIEEVLKMS